MTKKASEIPNADALIMAEAPGGELIVRNFEDMTEDQRIVERDVHQLKVLSLFGAINRQEFMLRHPGSLRKQGGNAARSLEGIREKRDELAAEARREFYDSLGLDQQKAALLEEGKPTADLERAAKREWTIFQGHFRRPEHAAARKSKIKELRQEVKLLQSTDNRAAGRRPHLSDKDREVELQPVLTTRERLIALRDDPRARFLPTTNREKNIMLTMLDYLDNPEYPLGPTNHLIEVFVHQGKPHVTSEKYTKKELPNRTARTIVYEVHDYHTNATISLQTLLDLEKVMAECVNPNVSIGEEAANHPGLRALIRFRDLERLRETGQQPTGILDALVAKEDRRPHEDPEKNKTVEDIYTRRTEQPEMLDYVADEADQLLVKDARKLLRAAIVDQENRVLFTGRLLKDLAIRAPGSRLWQAAGLAGRLVNEARIIPLGQPA